MGRQREQLSVRLDVRIIQYYDQLVQDWRKQWKDKRLPGPAPTRNWFIEQQLAQGAGMPEAQGWKEKD